MKKLLLIPLMLMLCSVCIAQKPVLTFKTDTISKKPYTIYVRVSKLPENEAEFTETLSELLSGIKIGNNPEHEIAFLFGIMYKGCSNKSENYRLAFDCLLSATNKYIANGYKW